MILSEREHSCRILNHEQVEVILSDSLVPHVLSNVLDHILVSMPSIHLLKSRLPCYAYTIILTFFLIYQSVLGVNV